MIERKPYHREHLRQDLLDAGREYVRKNGHSTLSIRTLATQVGVSAGAPYHHFPDRRSLLFALASEGFKEMIAGASEVEAGTMAPEAKLHRMGILFIQFADRNPHLLELMYESELTTPALDPELQQFQSAGHIGLRKQIVEAVPGLPPEEVDFRVIAFWSMIYGFVSMRKKGVIHASDEFVPRADIAEAIVGRAVLSAVAP
jgi:AcrR family transcriptional regulator